MSFSDKMNRALSAYDNAGSIKEPESREYKHGCPSKKSCHGKDKKDNILKKPESEEQAIERYRTMPFITRICDMNIFKKGL